MVYLKMIQLTKIKVKLRHLITLWYLDNQSINQSKVTAAFETQSQMFQANNQTIQDIRKNGKYSNLSET